MAVTTAVRHPRDRVKDPRMPLFLASSDDPFDHLAEYVREAVVAPLVLVRQPFVVNAEKMQNRGMEIVDVNAVRGDAVSERIGRSICDARL